MKYSLSFVFVILALFLYGETVSAQSLGQINQLATSINLELSPQNPGPNANVTVTLSSFDTDLNAASIAWSINGKTQASGKGKKTFSFSTGKSNTTTTLAVTIHTIQGETINKSLIIRPTTVDLIWEAMGYTPPFYKGKTLFSHQDQIKFIALPHIFTGGSEIPTSQLIYTWTKNGSVVEDFSGYGKNTYTMVSSIISRPLDIQVTVTSSNGDVTGEAETVVNPIEPTVVLYEKSPLYGIRFEKALSGTMILSGSKEIEVLAEPYFFGTLSLNDPSLSYTWNINNRVLDQDTSRTSRVFRQVEGASGQSFISLSVENANKILQSTSQGFNLEFGKTTTTQNTF